MQQKKQQQSIVYEQTLHKFTLQQQIVRKIIRSQLWAGRNHFPSLLIYEISAFVFQNPARLKQTMYFHWIDRIFKINQKYLLKGRTIQSNTDNHEETLSQKTQRNSTKSCFITIAKQWKAIDTRDLGYADIIMKGRLFLNFLSSIRIKVHADVPIDYDPLNDYGAFQKQQKQKSKHYTLISDNLNIVIKQFDQIFQYEKDKKINDVLIKAFMGLMSKNMVIVKIQENYNATVLGCEGKYLYIANRHQLPFMKNEHRSLTGNQLKNIITDFPWLQIDKNGEWRLGHSKHHGVSIYKQQAYPLKRHKRWLINKKLQYFQQNDVWINSI